MSAVKNESDFLETEFTECSACGGFYQSLEKHLKSWRKTVLAFRGDYSSPTTIVEDTKHFELYEATILKKERTKQIKQIAQIARKIPKAVKISLILPCGHDSTSIVWTNEAPVCGTCGLVVE